MLKIFGVGVNHRTASMDVLERYFLNSDRVSSFYKLLVDSSSCREMVAVQTCNRMELYFATSDIAEVLLVIKSFFELNESMLRENFYLMHERNCVQHLFEVVSSLDSIIVGEGQILGQIRDAYLLAQESQQTGKILNRLFEHAVKTGKRVRAQTSISRGAVSISQAAVELGRKVFRSLEGAKVLVLGAGHMGRLITEHLTSTKVESVKVLNRDSERAKKIIEYSDRRMSSGGLEEIQTALLEVDIVFGALTFEGYLLNRKYLEQLMPLRRYKPLFLVDISLPRVFDPYCSKLDNVFQFDIEDLKDVVDKNKLEREIQAELARKMIIEEVEEFELWLSSYQVAPLMLKLTEYKKLLVDDCTRNFSRCILEQIEQSGNNLSSPKGEISKFEEYHSKGVHMVAGKLQHIITQLVKNYPQDPLNQQRLAKIVKELVKDQPLSDVSHTAVKSCGKKLSN